MHFILIVWSIILRHLIICNSLKIQLVHYSNDFRQRFSSSSLQLFLPCPLNRKSARRTDWSGRIYDRLSDYIIENVSDHPNSVTYYLIRDSKSLVRTFCSISSYFSIRISLSFLWSFSSMKDTSLRHTFTTFDYLCYFLRDHIILLGCRILESIDIDVVFLKDI